MAGTFGRSNEQFKGAFFDRAAVQDAIDRAALRLLSRFGAYVRRRAITSIRRRKGASPPGTPPSAHAPSGDFASLKNILFAYEPARRSVVIGPVKINGARHDNPTVPELHEEGGVLPIREVLSGGRWVRKSFGKRWGQGKPERVRGARYPARPFMKPAYKAELQGKLAAQLRGMVRAA